MIMLVMFQYMQGDLCDVAAAAVLYRLVTQTNNQKDHSENSYLWTGKATNLGLISQWLVYFTV